MRSLQYLVILLVATAPRGRAAVFLNVENYDWDFYNLVCFDSSRTNPPPFGYLFSWTGDVSEFNISVTGAEARNATVNVTPCTRYEVKCASIDENDIVISGFSAVKEVKVGPDTELAYDFLQTTSTSVRFELTIISGNFSKLISQVFEGSDRTQRRSQKEVLRLDFDENDSALVSTAGLQPEITYEAVVESFCRDVQLKTTEQTFVFTLPAATTASPVTTPATTKQPVTEEPATTTEDLGSTGGSEKTTEEPMNTSATDASTAESKNCTETTPIWAIVLSAVQFVIIIALSIVFAIQVKHYLEAETPTQDEEKHTDHQRADIPNDEKPGVQFQADKINIAPWMNPIIAQKSRLESSQPQSSSPEGSSRSSKTASASSASSNRVSESQSGSKKQLNVSVTRRHLDKIKQNQPSLARVRWKQILVSAPGEHDYSHVRSRLMDFRKQPQPNQQPL